MMKRKKVIIAGAAIIFFALLINPIFMRIFADKIINPLVNTNLNIFENNLIILINLVFEFFLISIGGIFCIFPEWIIKKKETIKNICLFIIVFILFLIILEVINFGVIINRSSYYVWPPNLEKVFYPNNNLTIGINNPTNFTINSLGYRGTEFKNRSEEYRILVLGGSTTECLFLDDHEIWPYLLEKNLDKTDEGKNIIVMSIGKSGHETREHILQLNYTTKEYDPDLVIMLIGANDVVFTTRYGDDWTPLAPDYSRAFSYSPIYSIRESLSYKFFKVLWGILVHEIPEDPSLYPSKREERKNSIEISEMPNISAGLDYYKSNIEEIIKISKEKNISLLLMTQPALWKNNMPKEEEDVLISDWMVPSGHFSNPVITEIMKQYNLKLLDVCSKNPQIFCLDLDSKIPKDLNHFFDDMHYNEKGAVVVAQEISKFIKQNLIEFKD